MLHLRNNALWLMTGNNPRLSDEMSRRCIRLRIDPRIDMPWLRGGFKHPLIAEWAQENRSALVHAALILVQAWVAAGKPLHAKRLGSFEKWSGVMGGVLEVAGIPGFLGNLNELYEAADSDGQMWREFTGAWWEAYHDGAEESHRAESVLRRTRPDARRTGRRVGTLATDAIGQSAHAPSAIGCSTALR